MENEFCLTPYFLDEQDDGLRALAGEDWHVIEPTLPEGERQQRMIALYQPLRDNVAKIAGRGDRPVSIAGDCCTSIGVYAGLQKASLMPTLIWFDAHGDLYTCTTLTQADNADRESASYRELN